MSYHREYGARPYPTFLTPMMPIIEGIQLKKRSTFGEQNRNKKSLKKVKRETLKRGKGYDKGRKCESPL